MQSRLLTYLRLDLAALSFTPIRRAVKLCEPQGSSKKDLYEFGSSDCDILDTGCMGETGWGVLWTEQGGHY